MQRRLLMKGNEAVGEAAVRAGCRYFFGYPITPQNEIPEYLSRRLPEVGGVFVQAESEISAINMVYGAAGAGARVMTSSSSPGISLMMEGISYIAGAELPCVIVNMSRGGPGLGGIQPAQSDYFQATKGGGHGDYRMLVLAPASVQELADCVADAFDLADKYRNPVMVLGDGALGQMMEPVSFTRPAVAVDRLPDKPWATTGAVGRKPNIINSLYLKNDELEALNLRLKAKYDRMRRDEQRIEIVDCEQADIILVAYGITSRICRSAAGLARTSGLKVGIARPISLFPFPEKAFSDLAKLGVPMLVVELSLGQMVEDVKLAVNGKCPVRFYGKVGGTLPTPREILEKAWAVLNNPDCEVF